PDVCAGDQPGSATERVALDADDDRRWTVVDRQEHAIQATVVLDVSVVAEVDRRALPLDVRTRAEARAVAGQDDCPRVADVLERVAERPDQGGVEGVPPLGARKRDAEDVPVALDADPAHSRRSFSSSALTSRSTSASSCPKSSR